MKRLVLLLMFSLGSLQGKEPFATLTQTQAYAANLPEKPPVDNNDWLHPLFVTFHKSLQPSSLQKLLAKIGLAGGGAWTPESCIDLMQRTKEQRSGSGLTGNVVKLQDATFGSKFIVWGDLQGAFHSFVRDLAELKRQGVLDDNLRIIKPDHIFVFNGDLIDRSAYSLETLSLALRLMEENPQKVYYIRGNHEDKQRWRDYGLKRELIDRLGNYSDESVPFAGLLNDIFNTLPLALYVRTKRNGKVQLMRISHYGREDKRIDERRLSHRLTKGAEGVIHVDTLPKATDKERLLRLEAIIKGQSRSTVYQETDGLTLLPPDRGATAWTSISCPTQTYQELYGFANDAFCQVTIADDIEDSALGLYTQDVRTQDGFKTKTYNIVTGQQVSDEYLARPVERKKKEELIFGCTLDLTKGLRIQGGNIVRGVSARLNRENSKGGIDGKQLRFVVLDDQYIPNKARRNIETLQREYGVDMILAPMGSPTQEAWLDLVRDKKVLSLFPATGAPIFRQPELDYMIHFKTSYYNEGIALVRQAISEFHTGKFAFFYQDDAFGKGALDGAKAELKRAGIKDYKAVSYRRNTVDFSTQSKEVEDYNPDAIFFFATTIAVTAFIRQIGVSTLSGKSLYGLSDMGEEVFRAFMRSKGIRMTIANIVPNPKGSMLPVVQEYRKAMNSRGYSVDPFSLEGYIAATILVDLIKRTSDPITKDKLVATAQQTKDYKLDGLVLTYDPKTKELTKDIWLDTGEGDWLYRPVKTESVEEKEEIVQDDLLLDNTVISE